LQVVESDAEASLKHPEIRFPFWVKLTLPSVPAGEEVATIAALIR
jgi:hypothetical protein